MTARKKGIYYLFCLVVTAGLKYYYHLADSAHLLWILAPTAWWVRILSGIPFEFQPAAGYVNHSLRFIIAPSCSGVQFLILSIAALTFSFLHRMKDEKKCRLWILSSVCASYLFTILVNGFRIILSIHLPPLFRQLGWFSEGLTPERLHSIIGISVYFTALFFLYQLADRLSGMLAQAGSPSRHFIPLWETEKSSLPSAGALPSPKRSIQYPMRRALLRWAGPVFWYFLIVLGLPFLNRAYEKEGEAFLQYALLLIILCLIIVALSCGLYLIWWYRHLGDME